MILYNVCMDKLIQTQSEPITEIVGDESYTYFSLGNYIVRAIDVCGGRPTFKYTRIEVSLILSFLASGESIEDIVADYRHPHLTHDAIYEAITLANTVFAASSLATKPLAA